MVKDANSPQEGRNDNRRDQDAREIVPGHAYNRLNEYSQILAKPINEIQVHNKAARMIINKYAGITPMALNSLAIVETYLLLHGKQRQHVDLIIDWSGAAAAWKRKIGRGITELILEGYLITTGKSISISEEGARILQDYDNIFEEAKQIYLERAEKARNYKRPKKDKNKFPDNQ